MRTIIRSLSNRRLKTAAGLHSRSGVIRNGLFLMEGPRFVRDHLDRHSAEWLFISGDASEMSRMVADDAEAEGTEVLELVPGMLEKVSDTENSQGLIAVCRLPEPDIRQLRSKGIMVLLDRVSDPGNMGSVIRSAAAFGCSAVIAGRGSCCPFIPKVTRAAAGTNTIIPVHFDVDLAGFIGSRREEMMFLGADASGERLKDLIPGPGPIGLVIGSEPIGISGDVRDLLHRTVGIPIRREVESLNAAVSASVILYELTRGADGP